MDGERALIYSRIRENRLDPSENDLTRGRPPAGGRPGRDGEADVAVDARQAAFRGRSLIRPLTTDLFDQRPARARVGEECGPVGNALYCRLGGDPRAPAARR